MHITPSHTPIDANLNAYTKLYSPPAPTVAGTACLLSGLVFAYGFYPTETSPTGMASITAITVGIALLVSLLFDNRKGSRNLFRTDLLCLVAIYGLTLAEFLFPQSTFDLKVTPEQTITALNIVLSGMGALALGRHLVPAKPLSSKWLNLGVVSNQAIFRIFLISAVLAYLYMLLAVKFNPVELIEAMLRPRFAQPWSRGRLGSWSTLLNELALLSYILPPIAGIIWNRRQFFSGFQKMVVVTFWGLTMFHAFASGTRNIFIIHLATFLIAYLLTLSRNTFRNTVVPILLTLFIALYGSFHMLEFRSVGLQKYLDSQGYVASETRDTLAIDYNLASMGWITEAIPQNHDYLGGEVLYWALVKPVPRALWPGKPEGLSTSIEEIAGAKGWTVAVTYLGESYMMAGMLGVIGMSLFLGALAAWWNRIAMQMQSDYGLLIYAMGFFAAAITMRSLFWLTTAILPVIALIVVKKFIANRQGSHQA